MDPAVLSALPRQRTVREVDLVTGEVREAMTSADGLTEDGLLWRVDNMRGHAEVVVEASVPRLLRGDNRQPATVLETRMLLSRLYDDIGTDVEWLCSVEDLSLMRVDVARSFTGDSRAFGSFLAALGKTPPVNASSLWYPDRSHTGLQTLMRFAERWETRVYQRGPAYLEQALRIGPDAERLRELAALEAEVLRFELQMRSRLLVEKGLARVGDLDEGRLAELAHTYFRRSRFDRRVGGRGGHLAAVAAQLQEAGTYKGLGPLAGALVLHTAGLPSPYGPATTTKYRRLGTELDLTGADIVADALQAMALEWESGRLLVGPAADITENPPPRRQPHDAPARHRPARRGGALPAVSAPVTRASREAAGYTDPRSDLSSRPPRPADATGRGWSSGLLSLAPRRTVERSSNSSSIHFGSRSTA